MRNIQSTNAGVDVSEEYAERVVELIDAAPKERETTLMGEYGQTDCYIRLHSYEIDGAQRWAVDYQDPASRELEEADEPGEAGRREAEARYEEFVRSSAAVLGEDREGIQVRFSSTDVEGVPGPLPEFPEVGHEHMDELLDSPADAPVLHLVRTEDGEGDELELRVAPAEDALSGTVLITREALVKHLLMPDTGTGTAGRLSSDDLTPEDRAAVAHAIDEAKRRRRGAASVLFA